jgi:RiboL-PSP-HEPN
LYEPASFHSMAYDSHFKHADDVVTHLNSIVPQLRDPLLESKYVGFVTIAAVTVYEMAIKDIFLEFAQRKHLIFGNFVKVYFERINGKIKKKVIEDEYLAKFGEKYVERFRRNIDSEARRHLGLHRRDVNSAYANLITWRNSFAHEGAIKTTATYIEAVQSYEDGKIVIRCLADALKR